MSIRIILPVALVAVVAAAALAVARVDEPGPIPRERVAEEPVPVEQPEDGRQVLSLEFELTYESGRLQSAELASSEQIASAAPKVFLRRGGTWLIEASGSREVSFYTFDPGWREAELFVEGEDGEPYEWIPITGVVRWPLVIPLYADGASFEVDRIQVTEVNTGELVFESEVR